MLQNFATWTLGPVLPFRSLNKVQLTNDIGAFKLEWQSWSQWKPLVLPGLTTHNKGLRPSFIGRLFKKLWNSSDVTRITAKVATPNKVETLSVASSLCGSFIIEKGFNVIMETCLYWLILGSSVECVISSANLRLTLARPALAKWQFTRLFVSAATALKDLISQKEKEEKGEECLCQSIVIVNYTYCCSKKGGRSLRCHINKAMCHSRNLEQGNQTPLMRIKNTAN